MHSAGAVSRFCWVDRLFRTVKVSLVEFLFEKIKIYQNLFFSKIFCWLFSWAFDINFKWERQTKIQLLIYDITWIRSAVRCWYVYQLITLHLVANEIKKEWVSVERLGYVSLLKVQVAVDIFSKLFAFSPISLSVWFPLWENDKSYDLRERLVLNNIKDLMACIHNPNMLRRKI